MPRHIDSKPLTTVAFLTMALSVSAALPDNATQDDGKQAAGDEQQRSETKAEPTPDVEGDVGLPIVKVSPIYPDRALKEGIEGHVLLEFVVTETGAVRDAVVLEAKPSGVFERAALNAVAKFKYKPRIVDGRPVESPGVRNRIAFEISDDEKTSSETKAQPSPVLEGEIELPIVKVAPIYPERAIKEGIEGDVLLEFVVTETGAVRDAVVVEAKPSGVFEQAALNAVGKFKYKPRIVDGKPVETPGVRNRFSFEISD